MKWNCFTLKTKTEAEDIVICTLAEVGIEGVEIQDKQPLTDEDKAQMFVDIMPEGPADDGIAYLNFYLEEDADTEAILKDVKEALEDLRQGKLILVTDDPDRENEGDFICAAEFATTENINFMAVHGKGLICMPMSEAYVEKLQLPQMVTKNTDNHETAFTVSIDCVDTTTGISAAERSITAMRCVAEDAKPATIAPFNSRFFYRCRIILRKRATRRKEYPGCGSRHPLRTLGGTRVLPAAAPTAPPCIGRRPRSSPLPETWAGCKSTRNIRKE